MSPSESFFASRLTTPQFACLRVVLASPIHEVLLFHLKHGLPPALDPAIDEGTIILHNSVRLVLPESRASPSTEVVERVSTVFRPRTGDSMKLGFSQLPVPTLTTFGRKLVYEDIRLGPIAPTAETAP